VTAFVNVLTSSREPNLNFEEIEVRSSCAAVGKTIGELDVAKKTGSYIVAIRKSGGELELRPSKATRLEVGDIIVGIGSPDEIRSLERMFEDRAAVV
jgi:voltage-gated potassium channel